MFTPSDFSFSFARVPSSTVAALWEALLLRGILNLKYLSRPFSKDVRSHNLAYNVQHELSIVDARLGS